MSVMFCGVRAFNTDISNWDVSSVIDMSGMSWDVEVFNGDLSKWDVSRVSGMSAIFVSHRI